MLPGLGDVGTVHFDFEEQAQNALAFSTQQSLYKEEVSKAGDLVLAGAEQSVHISRGTGAGGTQEE